jgi:hypothetical protein
MGHRDMSLAYRSEINEGGREVVNEGQLTGMPVNSDDTDGKDVSVRR